MVGLDFYVPAMPPVRFQRRVVRACGHAELVTFRAYSLGDADWQLWVASTWDCTLCRCRGAADAEDSDASVAAEKELRPSA